jgi:hypothetical protein
MHDVEGSVDNTISKVLQSLVVQCKTDLDLSVPDTMPSTTLGNVVLSRLLWHLNHRLLVLNLPAGLSHAWIALFLNL